MSTIVGWEVLVEVALRIAERHIALAWLHLTHRAGLRDDRIVLSIAAIGSILFSIVVVVVASSNVVVVVMVATIVVTTVVVVATASTASIDVASAAVVIVAIVVTASIVVAIGMSPITLVRITVSVLIAATAISIAVVQVLISITIAIVATAVSVVVGLILAVVTIVVSVVRLTVLFGFRRILAMFFIEVDAQGGNSFVLKGTIGSIKSFLPLPSRRYVSFPFQRNRRWLLERSEEA